MEPAAETQEDRQSLIDGSYFFPRKLTEGAPDSPFVDRTQLVDQREGLFGETAWARREGRIKETLARRPSHRRHAHQPKALVADDIRIAYDDAGPHATLLAADGGVKSHHDNSTPAKRHSRPSNQPLPGTHRTGLPALQATSASVSSSGKPRAHSSNPCSARLAKLRTPAAIQFVTHGLRDEPAAVFLPAVNISDEGDGHMIIPDAPISAHQ